MLRKEGSVYEVLTSVSNHSSLILYWEGSNVPWPSSSWLIPPRALSSARTVIPFVPPFFWAFPSLSLPLRHLWLLSSTLVGSLLSSPPPNLPSDCLFLLTPTFLFCLKCLVLQYCQIKSTTPSKIIPPRKERATRSGEVAGRALKVFW